MQWLAPALILAAVSASGAASARGCTPDEWEQDRRWSEPTCTRLIGARPKAQQHVAPVPSKASVGVERWAKDVTGVLRLMRASIQTGDRDELQRQSYRAAELVGEVGRWPDHDAWRTARARCVMAPQTLQNFSRDIRRGDARGLVSAEAELDAHAQAVRACSAALANIR